MKNRLTEVPNGVTTGKEIEKVADYTVVNDDTGSVFIVGNNDVIFTLPAISLGRTFKFVFAGNDGQGSITLSPNASDGIMYAASATDNKDLILTKATAKTGDFIVISSIDSAAHWYAVQAEGTLAKEA